MTRSFEVHVEGVLATSTVRALGCDYYFTESQATLRVAASPESLRMLLALCARYGLTLDSIVRVDAR